MAFTTFPKLYPTSNSTSNSTSSSSDHCSAQTNSTSVSHAGVSSGAAAGIGIGCAIAGLAIGIFLALFFASRREKTIKRRHRTGTTMSSHSRSGNTHALPKGPSSTTSTVSRRAIATGTTESIRLNQYLLESKSDSTIRNELQALGDLILQHVESYYHVSPAQGSHSALSSTLSALGLENESSISSSLLVEIAFDPDTRPIALQHIISCVILGSFVFPRDSRLFSLLPASVSMFLQEIPKVEAQRGNQQAYDLALTRWRQLTAFLLNSNRSGRTPLIPHNDKLAPRAKELVHKIEPFLDVFVIPKLRNSQQRHLEDIILECAKFGYLLFSQPGELRLTFTSGQEPAGSTELVVCPGLDRVSDDQGNRYTAAQSIISAQMRRYN